MSKYKYRPLTKRRDVRGYYYMILKLLNEYDEDATADTELPVSRRFQLLLGTNHRQTNKKLYEMIMSGCVEAIIWEKDLTRFRITRKGKKLLRVLQRVYDMLPVALGDVFKYQ